MENVNINWTDPFFGEIPIEHRDWYLKESGTFWDNVKKDWAARGLQKISRSMTINTKNGAKIETVMVLKAEDFQNKMLQMKDFIRGQIENGIYTISNGNAFDLMRYGETKIEITYGRNKKIQTIKLMPF